MSRPGGTIFGLVLSLIAGDSRLMMAKGGAVSGRVGMAVLVSVFFGQPRSVRPSRPVDGPSCRWGA